ncbi:MAG: hypothetical protein AB8B97_01790 [Granulosicoccus sp.]
MAVLAMANHSEISSNFSLTPQLENSDLKTHLAIDDAVARLLSHPFVVMALPTMAVATVHYLGPEKRTSEKLLIATGLYP